MRNFIFLLILIPVLNACNTMSTNIEVVGDMKEVFAHGQSKAFTKLDLPDQAYWSFFSQEYLKGLPDSIEPLTFLDTSTFLSHVKCDCTMKNDSIKINGGVSYGSAGIGFNISIVDNNYTSYIWKKGASAKTKSMQEFKQELILQPTTAIVKLDDLNNLAPQKTLYGQYVVETEEFISPDKENPEKIFMKVLFKCLLD